MWRADTGRDPSRAELAALVGRAVVEEVLVRSAREVGLQKTDTVVWRRLVENMRFTAVASADAPDAAAVDDTVATPRDAALHAEALALGMDESDVVVRRRLAERMSQRLKELGRGAEPTDDELRDFIARHPAEFTDDVRVRFAQVFLSRQRRGASLEDDAERVRAALAARADDAAAGAGLGDPSAFPSEFPFSSEHDLTKRLGTEFAESVMGLAPGAWRGPIASSYGLHFVLVRDVQPATVRTLETVRARARYGVLREREEQALVAGVRELRERYDVVVAGLDAEEAPR